MTRQNNKSLLNPFAKSFYPIKIISPSEILAKLGKGEATPDEFGIICSDNNQNLIEICQKTDPIHLSIMYVLLTKFSFDLPSKPLMNFQLTINFIFNKAKRSDFDLCFLAKMYRKGVIFNVNYQAAADLYEEAIVKYNSQMALIDLAYMLSASQIGVLADGTPNLRRARQLYELAGDVETAKARLKELNERLENDTWPANAPTGRNTAKKPQNI